MPKSKTYSEERIAACNRFIEDKLSIVKNRKPLCAYRKPVKPSAEELMNPPFKVAIPYRRDIKKERAILKELLIQGYV
jgi:hypothetical protein